MKATVNLLISSDSALFNEGQKAAKAFKPSLVKASMFDKRRKECGVYLRGKSRA